MPEQCDGEECWCVDELGSTVPDTQHTRYGSLPSVLCGTLCNVYHQDEHAYHQDQQVLIPSVSDARLQNVSCSGSMLWKEGQNTCESTCEEPAPDCEGEVARCACPLSNPIMQNGECTALQECQNAVQGERSRVSSDNRIE